MVDTMTLQKKDNRGYTFPNTNKNKPTQPDHTGKATLDGKEWSMAAWENITPDGKKYLSFAFSIPLPVDPNAVRPNNSSNQQQTPQRSSNVVTPIVSTDSNDLDDLDAILRSADDDDNPFN